MIVLTLLNNKSPTLAFGCDVNDFGSLKLDPHDFRFQVECRGSDPPIQWLIEITSLEVVSSLHEVTRTFRTVHPHLDIALQSPKWYWTMLGSWNIKASPELMYPRASAFVLINNPMIPLVGITLAGG